MTEILSSRIDLVSTESKSTKSKSTESKFTESRFTEDVPIEAPTPPELSRTKQSGLASFSHESEVRSYCRSFDATFATASGTTMVDDTGRSYIDFLAGCGSLNYGHNDPEMTDALVAYVQSGGISHGLDMRSEAKEDFIQTFADVILKPRSLDYRLQFPGPTGTNAVEAAMKLARKVTGRTEIVAFTNGFHGCTLGALAATGSRSNRMGSYQPLSGVSRALYDGYLGPEVNTAAILDQLLTDPSGGFDLPAAILVEGVQGEGGLNAASDGWLREVADIAKRHGALLIVDDIQAGCGRTASFFSFESAGIQPDMVVLSKSLSGFGLPMSLVLLKPEHDLWSPGEHNGTFRGNNLAFVTATVALKKFWQDDELSRSTNRRGGLIASSLAAMATDVPDSRVKGREMMTGLDVVSGELASRICRRSFESGLIVETSGAHGEVVKILAPLTTPDALLVEGLEILQDAIRVETASAVL